MASSLAPEGVPYGGLLLHAFYYGSLGFLVELALYRMRRYRLTRTAWRGVRFGLDGSALKYALIAWLYGLVTLATLGLAYPWQRMATTRYLANNARFGTTCFSFEGSAFPLFLRWSVVMAPALAAGLLFFLVNAELLAYFWSQLRHEVPDLESIIDTLEYFNWQPLGLLLVSAVFRVWYRVGEFRYVVNAVRIGGYRLGSGLKAKSVYKFYFWFYFLFFLCVVAAVIFAEVSGLLDSAIEEDELGLLIGLLVFVSGYWLYGLCKTLFVKISLLALACETLSIQEPEVLGRAVQSTAALPGHGEGLADALDVGGF